MNSQRDALLKIADELDAASDVYNSWLSRLAARIRSIAGGMDE